MTEVAERPAPAPSPSEHRGLRGNPALTLVAISLGVMMVALEGTVVSVANPTIQRDLNATLAGLQWVTNGYLLALAVLLIPGGKLGDRFGRRRIFASGSPASRWPRSGARCRLRSGCSSAFASSRECPARC